MWRCYGLMRAACLRARSDAFEEVDARHQVPERGRVAERIPLGVDAKEGRENVPAIHGRPQALQRFVVSPERVQQERFMMRW